VTARSPRTSPLKSGASSTEEEDYPDLPSALWESLDLFDFSIPGITEACQAIRSLRRAQKHVGAKRAATLVADEMRQQWASDNATVDELIACGDSETLSPKLYDARRVKSRGDFGLCGSSRGRRPGRTHTMLSVS